MEGSRRSRSTPAQTLRADTFVFAVGPWMGKTFPELLAKKTRVPIGYVCYFGTPVNDHRFTFPNLPSFNFPGVTGWPALPVDNRGFRVRGAERAPTPPGEVAAVVAATDAATPAGAPATHGSARQRCERGDGRGGGGRQWRGGGGGGGGGGQDSSRRSAGAAGSRHERSLGRRRRASRARAASSRTASRLLKDAPIAQTHACHYESTSSGNFIIDMHPQMSNAWIVAGGNAEGFKFSPVIGEYAAQRVMGIEGDPAIAKGFQNS